MHDAIIGINEKQEILFINTTAKSILGLNGDKMQGKSVSAINKQNDLFKSIVNNPTTNKSFKIVVDGKDAHFQLETREIFVPNLSPDDSKPIILAQKPAGWFMCCVILPNLKSAMKQRVIS